MLKTLLKDQYPAKTNCRIVAKTIWRTGPIDTIEASPFLTNSEKTSKGLNLPIDCTVHINSSSRVVNQQETHGLVIMLYY